MVERRGLLLSRDAPVTTGAVPEGYLRVVVTRASASVPGCPNWDSKSSLNPVNATSSNYGCATNGNLAAMVADPNDLIKGTRDTGHRSEEHTSELQSLMRISYAVFCLKKKNKKNTPHTKNNTN